MTTEAKGGCCLPDSAATAGAKPATVPELGTGKTSIEVVDLSGGWFQMGANDGPHPEDGEGPVREVFVDPFRLAATAVTIGDYAEFVSATGYQTLAEGQGNSFVFHLFCDAETSFPAPVQAPWWRQVPGACWHSPDGLRRAADEKADHPVTHIAREDALAYCRWSNTRLPTEAEWEIAARGGLVGQPYPWGDKMEMDGIHWSNVWQGAFPDHNTGEDGHIGTAPVREFPPNGWRLYNMTGNVWEWVADRFTTLHPARPVRNPKGPLNGLRFVAKGGSYLCHSSYCERYRTSSRQSLLAATTTGNLGFRVAARTKPDNDTV